MRAEVCRHAITSARRRSSRVHGRPPAERASAGGTPLVIVVAPTVHDRARLASSLESSAPLLFVSSIEQARAVLEQAGGNGVAAGGDGSAAPGVDSCGGLLIDPDRHVAEWDGRESALTPLEFGVLECLAGTSGRTWTFAQLHDKVWGTSHVGRRADMHSVVKRLRGKLARLDAPVVLDAIRGVGFRLTLAAPRPVVAAPAPATAEYRWRGGAVLSPGAARVAPFPPV